MPLASASIGQVHRALLKQPEGEPLDVVLKIQRPNIKDTIERDIDLLYWMARGVERAVPESKLYSPVRLVGEFDRAIAVQTRGEGRYAYKQEVCGRCDTPLDVFPLAGRTTWCSSSRNTGTRAAAMSSSTWGRSVRNSARGYRPTEVSRIRWASSRR